MPAYGIPVSRPKGLETSEFACVGSWQELGDQRQIAFSGIPLNAKHGDDLPELTPPKGEKNSCTLLWVKTTQSHLLSSTHKRIRHLRERENGPVHLRY